jgi:NAD(P)-dependent dehydrogenase (short-subunit alcohol dehydrogenase family)
MPDQYTFDDPAKRYPSLEPRPQQQEAPGDERRLDPPPDLGETTYRGTGRLTGRKALITGGDSGIGAAVAIAFAREGADVAIAYLPSEEQQAQRIAGLVQDAGRTAVTLPGDVADPDFCRDAVERAAGARGGLDELVSNAGHQQWAERLEDVSDEQFERTWRTNVAAFFHLVKTALPHLGPGSAVIATTSKEAYSPSPLLADYAMTKGAINTFTKVLAMQLAPRGIRVNAVAPGPTWTVLQAAGGQPPGKLPHFGGSVPMGRPGQPAELAPAFVYLASAESSYVAGETLNVNGGLPTP